MDYEEEKEITLPKELQIEMLKFFLKTSIPRSKKINPLLSKNDKEEQKQ